MSTTTSAVPAMSAVHRILVIDANPETAKMCQTIAADCPCEIRHAATLSRATELLNTLTMHLVISDMAAPVFGDRGLLRLLKSRFLPLPLICVANNGTPDEAAMAVRFGAADYLAKPLCPNIFKERILGALSRLPASPGIEASAGSPVVNRFGMIGNSPLMQKLYFLIDRFSSGDFCVAILGETGTGKELVAKAIHDSGSRCSQPFVPVDCAAITSSLIESELFGHVRGSFTGALSGRTGPLVAAKSGTVFLDEIGELPLGLQGKLLRAIQEKAIRPVGGNEFIRLGARFVVATNRDLLRCVADGTFRSDLYFRITVGQITVPALRDRKTDIPLLAVAFLRHANRMVSAKRDISDSVMRTLVNYSWPGNVRELQNVIHRAVILSERRLIENEDLPTDIADFGIRRNEILGLVEAGSLNVEALELATIRRAMTKALGNKLLAAKLLGMGKSTLYRKLRAIEQNELKALQTNVS